MALILATEHRANLSMTYELVKPSVAPDSRPPRLARVAVFAKDDKRDSRESDRWLLPTFPGPCDFKNDASYF